MSRFKFLLYEAGGFYQVLPSITDIQLLLQVVPGAELGEGHIEQQQKQPQTAYGNSFCP